MNLNREGRLLLRVLIDKFVPTDCIRDAGMIAQTVNAFMPRDMQVTSADVQSALNLRMPGEPMVNLEMLREKIDKCAVLYSARVNGECQAIFNEMDRLPEFAGSITLEDVRRAMALRPVPQPTNVVQGAARLVGTSRIG